MQLCLRLTLQPIQSAQFGKQLVDAKGQYDRLNALMKEFPHQLSEWPCLQLWPRIRNGVEVIPPGGTKPTLQDINFNSNQVRHHGRGAVVGRVL